MYALQKWEPRGGGYIKHWERGSPYATICIRSGGIFGGNRAMSCGGVQWEGRMDGVGSEWYACNQAGSSFIC